MLVVLAILTALGGCASPRQVLYSDGPTMKETLEGARVRNLDAPPGSRAEREDRVREGLRASAHAHVRDREMASYEAYTRTALNELEQLFPKLENPTLGLYVDPHLGTDDRAPIPGYMTSFTLYERDEFALPEEVPPSRFREGPPVTHEHFVEPASGDAAPETAGHGVRLEERVR